MEFVLDWIEPYHLVVLLRWGLGVSLKLGTVSLLMTHLLTIVARPLELILSFLGQILHH